MRVKFYLSLSSEDDALCLTLVLNILVDPMPIAWEEEDGREVIGDLNETRRNIRGES